MINYIRNRIKGRIIPIIGFLGKKFILIFIIYNEKNDFLLKNDFEILDKIAFLDFGNFINLYLLRLFRYIRYAIVFTLLNIRIEFFFVFRRKIEFKGYSNEYFFDTCSSEFDQSDEVRTRISSRILELLKIQRSMRIILTSKKKQNNRIGWQFLSSRK